MYRYGYAELERQSPRNEANTFASEPLMATALFRPRCAHAEPNLTVVKGLAQEFQTTLTATAVRFVEACHAACLVVLSEQGWVRWWRKSATVRGVCLEPAQALHCESLA